MPVAFSIKLELCAACWRRVIILAITTVPWVTEIIGKGKRVTKYCLPAPHSRCFDAHYVALQLPTGTIPM